MDAAIIPGGVEIFKIIQGNVAKGEQPSITAASVRAMGMVKKKLLKIPILRGMVYAMDIKMSPILLSSIPMLFKIEYK